MAAPVQPPVFGRQVSKAVPKTRRSSAPASLPVNSTPAYDPYAKFYNGEDSSDDEAVKEVPTLYVRGKNPIDVENLMKTLKKQKHVPGAKLAYDKKELKAKGVPMSKFDANKYFHRLQSWSLGNTLLTTSDIASTQTMLKENFSMFPVGTVLVADTQDSGRGRGGNEWSSPKGCLMFSFTTQIADGTTLPFVQYVVALSIVQAVQQEAGFTMGSPFTDPMTCADVVNVRIKWPNDIYGPHPWKIGGILCESGYDMEAKMFNLTIGCGLNVANSEPTTCLNDIFVDRHKEMLSCSSTQRPTHVETVCPTREVILGAIMSMVEVNMRTFKERGFDALKPAYLRHWLHTHQTVTLIEIDDNGVRTDVPVIIRGLTPSGYLLATDSNNQPFELHPDGNSLDFFKGLVRRKIQ